MKLPGHEDDGGEQQFHKMRCTACGETNTTPGKQCPSCGSFSTVPASY